MVHYRRAYIPGASYFFTVTLRNRRSQLLVEHVDVLRAAVHTVKQLSPFTLDAAVILPDHLHMIWTLPEGDSDFSGRWRAIKARFTHALVDQGVALHRNPRGEYDLWQRRFWEHWLRDEVDFGRHVDYIHYNPVKHGHADRPAAWPWSSIHRYIETGILSPDWASTAEEGDFGE
ncbi:MAG: REP-associated tyrosine transposase [Candidatus Competibacteraceae bacterium]|jgi:putative transposase